MDKRGTAALCLRAGFGAGHYLAVRMALDLAQSGVAPTTRQSAYTTEALEFLRNQYERLRARPDVVEKLLQGA